LIADPTISLHIDAGPDASVNLPQNIEFFGGENLLTN
jgi:hypothetical protein